MKSSIPQFVQPFLWSYDVSSLDLEKDKKRIITNILNYGTKNATDWLFSKFDKKDIYDAVENPFVGEWDKKSINFWSLIFGIKSGNLIRRVS